MDFSKVKINALAAEFVGTFALAGAVLASINGSIPLIATPVVAALTLGLFVMSVGGISGTHINPAVTAGLWSVKKIDTANAIGYILAQVAGAFAALGVINYLTNGAFMDVGGAGDFDWRVLFAEATGMALFTFGIAGAVHSKVDGANAGLLVGGSLLLGILVAAVASNGVLNPAVAGAIDSFNWAYLIGPILGSVIGFNLYQMAITAKGKL